MHFRILCVGKIRENFYKRQIEELCAQIRKKQNLIEIIEFPDERIPKCLTNKNKESFLEKECAKLGEKISSKDYTIVLCIEGKELTTGQHKEYVIKAKNKEFETVTYVIGGSLGLPEQLKNRADLKMSFSKMTFPHQMMRMVLCEEIACIVKSL